MFVMIYTVLWFDTKIYKNPKENFQHLPVLHRRWKIAGWARVDDLPRSTVENFHNGWVAAEDLQSVCAGRSVLFLLKRMPFKKGGRPGRKGVRVGRVLCNSDKRLLCTGLST